MCLGIPMRIKEIDGYNAICEAKGVERTVSLFMMQDEDIKVGDMVMIHVGYAIQKMTEQEAQSAWEMYEEILAAEGYDMPVGDVDANNASLDKGDGAGDA